MSDNEEILRNGPQRYFSSGPTFEAIRNAVGNYFSNVNPNDARITNNFNTPNIANLKPNNIASSIVKTFQNYATDPIQYNSYDYLNSMNMNNLENLRRKQLADLLRKSSFKYSSIDNQYIPF